MDAFDLLLIELEQPVKGITSAMLNTRRDEMGAIAAGCGFGASGPANKPEDVGQFHKKIAGENTIDSLCGQRVNGEFSKLMVDFDHPSRSDCNIMGIAVPLLWNTVCQAATVAAACSGSGKASGSLLGYVPVRQWTSIN